MGVLRRYADWRPVPQRRLPARWIGTAAGAVAFVGIVALWGKPNLPIYMGSVALAALVSNRIAAHRLAALRDEAEDRQFAATLRLACGGAYGHDEGLVAFEDGFLVFMGRRCAFSLGARDVRVGKVAGTELEFEFRGPGGHHEAQLEFRRSARLWSALLDWRKASRRSPERVLPPARPDPGLPRTAFLLADAIPWIAFAVGLVAVTPSGNLDRLLYPVAPLAILAGAALRAAAQAANLARLERGERPRLASDAIARRLRRRFRRSLPVRPSES